MLACSIGRRHPSYSFHIVSLFFAENSLRIPKKKRKLTLTMFPAVFWNQFRNRKYLVYDYSATHTLCNRWKCDCRSFRASASTENLAPAAAHRRRSTKRNCFHWQINENQQWPEAAGANADAKWPGNKNARFKLRTICREDSQLQFWSWQLLWARLGIGERSEFGPALIGRRVPQCSGALAHYPPQ